MTFFMEKLARLVRVGSGKGQADGKKTLWHSRSELDLLFIGCICRYLAN